MNAGRTNIGDRSTNFDHMNSTVPASQLRQMYASMREAVRLPIVTVTADTSMSAATPT